VDPTTANIPQETSRVTALDGLRGVAALAVVIFHTVMLTPALAAIDRGDHGPSGWETVLTVPPLKLLWSGDEAVIVFFVLSGYVLTLPFLKRPFQARVFYPSRLVRLYVPTWASIVLAVGWFLLVPRHTESGASWWLNAHARPISLRALGGDSTLIIGTSWTNSVLWSLRWEVWFSLLFPVFLFLVLRLRKGRLVAAIGLLVLIGVGQAGSFDPLVYMPVFVLGMLAAAERDRLRALVARLGARGGWVLAVIALLLLDVNWLSAGEVRLRPAVSLGAVVLVVLAASWPVASRALSTPPLRWLGRISFSLYLVHEPIVVSVALLWSPTNSLFVLLVALPLSLAIGDLMYRFVERPSHQLARHLAARLRGPDISGAVGPTSTPEPPGPGVGAPLELVAAAEPVLSEDAVREHTDGHPQEPGGIEGVGTSDELDNEQGDKAP
jgi:peptidoglycan/LPS O-acetylase OafA/YrhL